jgi:hypothetical protein
VSGVAAYKGKNLIIRQDRTVLYDGEEIGTVGPDPADRHVNHGWVYAHISGTRLKDLRPDSVWIRTVQDALTKQDAARELVNLHLAIIGRERAVGDLKIFVMDSAPGLSASTFFRVSRCGYHHGVYWHHGTGRIDVYSREPGGGILGGVWEGVAEEIRAVVRAYIDNGALAGDIAEARGFWAGNKAQAQAAWAALPLAAQGAGSPPQGEDEG